MDLSPTSEDISHSTS